MSKAAKVYPISPKRLEASRFSPTLGDGWDRYIHRKEIDSLLAAKQAIDESAAEVAEFEALIAERLAAGWVLDPRAPKCRPERGAAGQWRLRFDQSQNTKT
jgi:hypothetical protein